jgi:hypothetical protein
MAVTLNAAAFKHAKRLIASGRFVYDDRDAWSEHQPTARQENEFTRLHGFGEYAKWYLGINHEKSDNTKGRYEFPYGDFTNAHRCGLLTAESRAGQYKHYDIEKAAHELHSMIESRRDASAPAPSPARSAERSGGKAKARRG